jgi:hypothetical protein
VAGRPFPLAIASRLPVFASYQLGSLGSRRGGRLCWRRVGTYPLPPADQGLSIPDVMINPDGPEEELAILCSRDHLLRQIRDRLWLKVISRPGEICVSGSRRQPARRSPLG